MHHPLDSAMSIDLRSQLSSLPHLGQDWLKGIEPGPGLHHRIAVSRSTGNQEDSSLDTKAGPQVWMITAENPADPSGVIAHIRNVAHSLQGQDFRVVALTATDQEHLVFDNSMGIETVGLPSLSSVNFEAVHALYPSGSVDAAYAAGLERELNAVARWLEPPDVIHAHDLAQHPRSVAAAVACFTECPKVLTTHSLFDQRVDTDIWTMGWNNLAVSDAIADAVRTHAPCAVLSPGFCLSADVSATTTLDTDRPIFLHLGRVVADKNTAAVLRSFTQICEVTDGALVLCDPRRPGRDLDPYQRDIFEQVDALPDPVRERVRWLRVTESNVAGVLARVRESGGAVVLPSIREGLPVAALETLASGVALVAGDIPGFREVVTHEMNGLLARPDDDAAIAAEMQRVITSNELRRTLERNGPASTHMHESEWVAAALGQTYSALV